MSWANGGEVLYVLGLAAGSLTCLFFMVWLRWTLRGPGGGSEAEALRLHPYEIAALHYGPDPSSAQPNPINIALTRMVCDGILAFDARDWTLSPRRELAADAHPLERAIYAVVVADPETSRFDAALVALLRGGALALTAGGRKLRRGGAAPDADRPLEQALYAAVSARPGGDVDDLRAVVAALPAPGPGVGLPAPPGRYIEEVRKAAAGQADALRRNLAAQGLVAFEDRAKATAPWLFMLALCLGVPWGPLLMAYEKNPLGGALLLPVIGSLCATILLGMAPLYRTRRGARVLARLKKIHAAKRGRRTTGQELVVSLGLFGTDAVTGTELAPLHSSQPALTRLWRWLRTRINRR